MPVWNWILTVTGSNNASGTWYLFWSGFAGCLIYLGIFGAIYRKLNCHASGCYRLGFHHVDGTPFITCKKHHPTGGNSEETIHQAHKRALKRA